MLVSKFKSYTNMNIYIDFLAYTNIDNSDCVLSISIPTYI